MGVGQLSESDAVDALRLPFYSSSHPTGSHGWRNQFDLGNPDLDNPELPSAESATYLPNDDLVLGLVWGGEARAYPVRMLWFHHIVND